MYYYEQAYTKLKDRLPGDPEYGRMNDDPRFLGMEPSSSVACSTLHVVDAQESSIKRSPPLSNRPRGPGPQIYS
jgi:hypothetical protein